MIEGISGSLPGLGAAKTGPQRTPADSPERIGDAAKQFEALLLAQMLKTVRESDDSGWLGTGEDQSASSAIGLAEEYFAQALATSGGLGISSLIVSGLERQKAAPEPAELKTPAPAVVAGR
jgi:Rod binding domain-containing protein